MIEGSRAIDALRLNTPDAGAVARSLLGVLAVAAVALYWNSPTAAVWAAGAATIAGAIALQDSPGGRVPLVIVVSLEMGAAVFLGTLTAPHDFVFIGAVGLWCFAAGMQWALGGNAGLVAAAASAMLVIAPPEAPIAVGRGGADVADHRRRLRSGRAGGGVAAAALADPARRVDDGLPGAGVGRPKCRH